MQAAYGMVLRAEFVLEGCSAGAPDPRNPKTPPSGRRNPTKALFFKVLPRGSTTIDGLIVGYPALDTCPHGLGHQVHETCRQPFHRVAPASSRSIS